MEVPSILILLTAFALTSCQTTDGPPFTDADLVAKRIDYDHRPLPADPKHLTIQGPDGAIHFTVPAGWHIAHQPSPNFPSYSLTHVGTFGDLPFLTVTLETGNRGRLSEEGSHEAYLRSIHSNFPSAYRRPAGIVALPDGRLVAIEKYLSGDVPELAAFVAEEGYVTAFFLIAETLEGIKRDRKSFERLIRSYHVH